MIPKYRALDKTDKKMWEVESLHIADEWVRVNDGSIYGIVKDLTSDFILLQYTGLKDKNGVDIYEGDIVTLKEEVSGYEEPNKIVIFHKGSFGWRDNEIGFVPFSILDRPKESIEVIGDIYENPELLGDNQ